MKYSPKAKTKAAVSVVSIDPAINKTAEPFVVVLWDGTEIQKFVSLPESLWSKNKKTGFPNVALFRLGGELDFRQGFGWKGFDDEAVFVVPTTLCEPTTPCKIQVDADYPYPVLQRRCCHFLTVGLRGNVPAPNTTPPQIIKGGFEGVIKTIEAMWPTARRLIATSLSRPPRGWELFRHG